MAQLSLYRGDDSKIKEIPIKDGQVLIGLKDNKNVVIYIDTKNLNQNNDVRIEIDIEDICSRISSLEEKYNALERNTYIIAN